MDKINFSPLLGIIGAFACISLAVDDIRGLIEPSSLVLVVGGTFMVILFRSSLEGMMLGMSAVGRALFHRPKEMDYLIDIICDLSTVVRADGVIALDGTSFGIRFLDAGLQSVADGNDRATITSTLEREQRMATRRHNEGIGIFTDAGDIAPAMGMIGTLIGLVNLLSNLSDPSSIGPAMAVALLTTLYGAILANVIFIPLAMKLESHSVAEELNNSLLIEGLLLLRNASHPVKVRATLSAYLSSTDASETDEDDSKVNKGLVT